MKFSLHFCLMGGGGLHSGLPLKFSMRTKAKPHVKTPTPESSKWQLLNKCSRRDFTKGQGCEEGQFWKTGVGKGVGQKTQAEEWRQGEDKGNQRMQPEENSVDARQSGKQPQEVLPGFQKPKS